MTQIPRAWHHWFPFLLLLAGLYAAHNYPDGISMTICITVVVLYSLAMSIGLEIRRVFYYAYLCGVPYMGNTLHVNEREPAESPIEKKVIPNLDADEYLMAFDVPMPKLQHEIRVAVTLLQQRRGGLKVNLTEKHWIKDGNFGGTAQEFRTMISNWEAWGVIARKEPTRANSPYVVVDWTRLSLVQRGEKLPLHSSLRPKM